MTRWEALWLIGRGVLGLTLGLLLLMMIAGWAVGVVWKLLVIIGRGTWHTLLS